MTEKAVLRAIFAFSAVVLAAVAILYNLPKADHIPTFVRWLPHFNAVTNSTCVVLLIGAYLAIRKKRVVLHKRLNITAFVLSALFLVSYTTFHTFGVETRYPADHPWRPIYLTLLLTHILLSVFVLPLVLITLYRGLTGAIGSHRRIARWTLPIWLYVAITGVIIYLMISPYYQF
ncbi:MAG: DUF420 domain-containing protein [Kiritimatiellae bacterium]|nr:DUF420 domain-containing protein [Kiritimatiellia bacterium]MCO5060781.1 DUF420 domain-containing protein [Kiritimatiellia bacterium]MCO6399860.1 DUF420 domain-containing protein [Verrucomicrobiota bacterium]